MAELKIVSLVGIAGLLIAMSLSSAIHGEMMHKKHDAEINNDEWNQKNPRPYDGDWILDNQHDT